MPHFFLALEEEQYVRMMFTNDETMHHIMPLFFDNYKISFRWTRDSAIYAAMQGYSKTSKLAPYFDTVWSVLAFELSDEEIGRLFQNQWIQHSPCGCGYEVTTGISVLGRKEVISWPRLGEDYWLTCHGFQIMESPLSTDTCDQCDRPASLSRNLFNVSTTLMCTECLIFHEMQVVLVPL
jgi:hypothetical protein